jgi:hypothetical protein
MEEPAHSAPDPRNLRLAEVALARLGFARIPPVVRSAQESPEFWVREPGVPRRTFPVFVEPTREAGRTPRPLRWVNQTAGQGASAPRAIAVVPDDSTAMALWDSARSPPGGPIDVELAILVLAGSSGEATAHWHRGRVPPRLLLRLATGVAVGLFRQAQAAEGGTQVDFSEMLEILKHRFQLDVAGSLGVRSDEESLFMLYQLAIRHAYAPGDAGSELHALALRPFGPGPRVPWFAA